MYAASYTARPANACIARGLNGTAVAFLDANTAITAKHTALMTGDPANEALTYDDGEETEGATTITAYVQKPDADIRLLTVSPAFPRYSAAPTGLIAASTSVAMGGNGQTATGGSGGTWISGSEAQRWGTNTLETNASGIWNTITSASPSTEAQACMHDSGGFMGAEDGSVLHGIHTAATSTVTTDSSQTLGTLLWPNLAWINSVRANPLAPPPLVLYVDFTNNRCRICFENEGTSTIAANDFTIVDSSGAIWTNTGSATTGRDEANRYYIQWSIERGLGTSEDLGSYSLAAGLYTVGGVANVAVVNCGYVEATLGASVAAPTLVSVTFSLGATDTHSVSTVWDTTVVGSSAPPSVVAPWGTVFDGVTTTSGDNTSTFTWIIYPTDYTATSGTPVSTVDIPADSVVDDTGFEPNIAYLDNAYTFNAATSLPVTAVSLDNGRFRARKKVATLTGTMTWTNNGGLGTSYTINVYTTAGVQVGTGSTGASFAHACTSGVSYIGVVRSTNAGQSLGLAVSEAAAASTSTTRTRAGFRSRGFGVR